MNLLTTILHKCNEKSVADAMLSIKSWILTSKTNVCLKLLQENLTPVTRERFLTNSILSGRGLCLLFCACAKVLGDSKASNVDCVVWGEIVDFFVHNVNLRASTKKHEKDAQTVLKVRHSSNQSI